MIAICIIILGLYVQPILAQDSAKNLTATVNTFTGEEGNKELKGNLIITEIEGKDKNINISFTDLIEENSSQVLDKSKIKVTSADLNKGQSKYTVTLKGYGVWVGEISINTTGIKSGTYDGKAIIEGANFTPLDVGLSVKLAKPTMLKFVVLFLASIFIIFAVYLLDKGPTKYIVLVLIAVLAGLLLFMFPLFDAPGNTLLATSFFIPLAASIVDYLTKRRDDRLALEKSVTEVKKKAVEDAVDFHSGLLAEISAHAATFSCIDGVGANPLEDGAWNGGKKKAGTVSDLHGLILAKYYQHTDDFNKYLKARNDGPKSLEDPKKFDDLYLFNWDDIPGNDSGKLIDFLKQSYSVDWIKAENIEKSDDGNTIRASAGNNSLSLSLNDEKTNVNLEIDDGRTDKFIVKTENGELNIYDGFCNKFNQFNKAYMELVDILYYNLFYNIGSFKYKFHSFKEFEVPFRIPDELRHYLADITGITGKKKYLFSWDDIPGNDNERLIKYLKKNFGIDWIKTANIKPKDGNKIIISTENKSLSLTLNKKKNKVNLAIDNVRADLFIAKMENDKLKIYDKEINKDKKFYSEKVAMKLMKKIETEFEQKYENLQERLQELSKFKIQESAAETSNAKKPS